MNGCIAQIVALTCHGNAVLQGREIPSFFPANSTCQFCEYVRFVEVKKRLLGKPKEQTIAPTPNEWFSYLKTRRATEVRLSRMPQNEKEVQDRMLAGFVGGGGTWSIEVVFPNGHSEFWLARWEVGNQNAQDRRVWRVTYGQVAKGTTAVLDIDLVRVRTQLLAALNDIRSFSMRQRCDGFTECFQRAIESLTTPQRHGYHRDLAPANVLVPEAEAILDACQSAWVFGGMGSWNDMGFDGDDGREYDRVSEQLFVAVTDAISAAATSSAQGQRFTPAIDTP
jgi:hypothetical protein